MVHIPQIESPVQLLENTKVIPLNTSTDLEICKECNQHVQRLLSLQLEVNEKRQLSGMSVSSCLQEQMLSRQTRQELNFLLTLWKKIHTGYLRDAYIYRFCSIVLQNGMEQSMLPEDVLYSILLSNKQDANSVEEKVYTSQNERKSTQGEYVDSEYYQNTIRKYASLTRKCQANFSFMVEELLKTSSS